VQFVQAYPDAFPMIGDLLADNMDWPGAKQLAARLRKMLPEALQDEVDPSALPPEVKAQLEQMEMQLQEITKAYETAQEEIQTDQVKERAKLEIKELELAANAASQERDTQARVQIEQLRQQGENARALAKIEQNRASEVLQAEISRMDNMVARAVEHSNRQEDRYEKIALETTKSGAGPESPPPGQPVAPAAPGAPPGVVGIPPSGPPTGPPPGPPGPPLPPGRG